MSDLSKAVYCPECGSRLVKTKIFVGYDETEGYKVYETVAECPNNKIFRPHYSKRFDRYDDKYWDCEI